MMKKLLRTSVHTLLLGLALGLSACTNGSKYDYETVAGDPLDAKIYTLPNGLKIYMTVNKEQPRIQTYIAVRAGGKNDPAETTGLAHYFEHLMFKGSEQFGTMNYEAEKPLLDQIEQLFEVYRKTTDEAERAAIYHQIDSISYEASKYSIPNEYDKLMAAIGANGTNAYTSYDVTCYVEDIPSNQIENWAKIQANRFEYNVIRGFHTELETIYEEKNMSLTKDNRKVIEALFQELFKKHPYGTQTVLGTQEHLKNPSITNVKNFYKQWYVPNNMAVCVSGDFDPDEMVDIISQYFGHLQPNDALPTLQFETEAPITEPRLRDVYGLEAENVYMAWRFPGTSSKEVPIEYLQIISAILNNGQAGLIDLNLNQTHKVLAAGAGIYPLSDYSAFLLMGYPMPGQTLEEVRTLLLAEIEKLRNGEFDESLVEAVVNDYKVSMQRQLEDNQSRADMFVQSFVNGTSWADEVKALDRLSAITKADIVAFAQKHLTDSNYVAINKRQGVDPNEIKVNKPAITPILTNRDTASAYLKEIQASVVEPIEPQFVDYQKDLSILTAKQDIEVLYKKNELNGLFELIYLFDMGNYADRELGMAAAYLDYLGTDSLSAEQVKSEFYRLGCSYSVNPGSVRTFVVLSGLNENLVPALRLFENLLANAKADPMTYARLVQAEFQNRQNQMSNQMSNFSKLRAYVGYGPKAIANQLTNQELLTINPDALVQRIHSLNSYEHRILYFGPSSEQEIIDIINAEHQIADTLQPVLANQEFPMRRTEETTIYIAPYNAAQIYMAQISNRGETFDPTIESSRILYNEYFGGGMSSIVFQEMRESRSLAYSASSTLARAQFKDEPYYMFSYIATQNDKMIDAISAFDEIINQMPQSEAAFQLAKEALINRLRTSRTVRSAVLWDYIYAQDLGLTEDLDKQLFNEVQNMTLQDVVAFQEKWIKDRKFDYCILGDRDKLDLNALKKIGNIKEVTTQEIFGY